MENLPKSPQEMAAQAMDSHPFYSGLDMPERDAEDLRKQANDMKAEVENWKPYTLNDEELKANLTATKEKATESGVWRADQGEGQEARLVYGTERNKEFGYTEEEATAIAARRLERSGYLQAIRIERRERERLFKDPINEYTSSHEIGADTEKLRFEALLERTVDAGTLSEAEVARLSHDFPSGNFVYHGTGTEQAIQILDTGILTNVKALRKREEEAAKVEGREPDFVQHNSGFEGISWSLNGIDALPGDRYHMAGFVAAPEAILSDSLQLAVPSRPAPNEVLQIPAAIDASEFYDAKTQFELYRSMGTFGEKNSVFSNLLSVGLWEDEEGRTSRDEPMLYRAKRGLLAQPEYQTQLRELYSVDDSGRIRIDSDLLQQIDNEVPIAAVWLQAAIDTGRLKDTQFSDTELPAIIDKLNSENVTELLAHCRQDWEPYEEIIDKADKVTGNIDVPVEKMYFVAPRKDAELWLKVMARSQHMPAGILLYDDKKVRLENFASLHRGDHAELTDELRAVIKPENEGYIDYDKVLGTKVSEANRTGQRHQVIAESELSNRGAIKKMNSKLVIER